MLSPHNRSRRHAAATAQALCAAVALCVPVDGARAQASPRVDTLAGVQIRVLRTPFEAGRAPLDATHVSSTDAATARPGFTVAEVLGTVAGVQADNRYNFALGERIAIRGIGARSQFGVRGIRVLVDDIPATLADGQTSLNNVDLGTLGGADVLRGPASALYGNASGGVIALTTAPPPPVPFAPEARLIRGSYGLTRTQFGVGGTHERATYLLSGDRFDYGGYRAYDQARNAHLNAVGTFDWSRASIRLVANAVQYDARNPGALSDSAVGADPRAAFPNNVLQQTGERGRQSQLGATTHASIGDGELRATVYGLGRDVNNPIPPRIIVLRRDAGGARLAYARDDAIAAGTRIATLAGVESDLQHDDRRNFVNSRGARGALVLDQLEHVSSVSPFVQMSASRGGLTALAALRSDAFRFSARDRLITATDPDDSGERTMSAVSPTGALSYAFFRGLVLRAALSTGFQTPTTTELANRPSGAGGFNPDLQPERTHSREVGASGRLAFVTYDATAYDMRVDDELISFEVPGSPGRSFYRNAGAARHRGIEADVSARPLGSMRVAASLAYTDARFVTYTSGSTSLASRRVPGITPTLAALTLQSGDPAGAFVSVDQRYGSTTPVNDANTARAPRYTVTNARGSWHDGPMGIIGGIDNVFDIRYDASVTINASANRYYEPAPGRSVYVGLEFVPR